MKIERVVVNASPLIVLCKGNLAHLFPQLFVEVLVPATVWEEVMAGGAQDPAAQTLPQATWARRVEVTTSHPVVMSWNLGVGESDVLNLAQSLTGYHAMIDDAAARACARTLGVPILGTGGALVLAKRRGLIPSVADALQDLRNVGLWLSEDVEHLLKDQVGE